jgi:hypothetical protein
MALLLLCHLQANSPPLDLNAAEELAQCKYCYDYHLNVIRGILLLLMLRKIICLKNIMLHLCQVFSNDIFW